MTAILKDCVRHFRYFEVLSVGLLNTHVFKGAGRIEKLHVRCTKNMRGQQEYLVYMVIGKKTVK